MDQNLGFHIYRDSDFLFFFKKMAFSISENMEFHFKLVEEQKFCFSIDFEPKEKQKFHLHKNLHAKINL